MDICKICLQSSMVTRISRNMNNKIGINRECRLLLPDDYPASLEINILVGV